MSNIVTVLHSTVCMSTNTGNNDMVIIYHTSRSYILLLTCYHTI